MDWFKADIELEGIGVNFSIIHNIDQEGAINSIDAAVDNWAARTDTFTDRSLCDYINGKGCHIAYTLEEYEKIIAE